MSPLVWVILLHTSWAKGPVHVFLHGEPEVTWDTRADCMKAAELMAYAEAPSGVAYKGPLKFECMVQP